MGLCVVENHDVAKLFAVLKMVRIVIQPERSIAKRAHREIRSGFVEENEP